MKSLTAGQRSGRREKTEMRGEGEDWIREGKQRFSVLLFLSLQLVVFSHSNSCYLSPMGMHLVTENPPFPTDTLLSLSLIFSLSLWNRFFVQMCCWTLQRFSDVLCWSISLYQNRQNNKLQLYVQFFLLLFLKDGKLQLASVFSSLDRGSMLWDSFCQTENFSHNPQKLEHLFKNVK